jgi:hypothetical protein
MPLVKIDKPDGLTCAELSVVLKFRACIGPLGPAFIVIQFIFLELNPGLTKALKFGRKLI